MKWLTGAWGVLVDIVVWMVKHPFVVATVVLGLMLLSTRADLTAARAALETQRAGFAAKLEEQTAKADTERGNALSAEAENRNLARQLDLAADIAKRNLELRQAADARAAEALQAVQSLRYAAARSERESRAAMERSYATDPIARAWGAVPVPDSVARRLRDEAPGAPPG